MNTLTVTCRADSSGKERGRGERGSGQSGVPERKVACKSADVGGPRARVRMEARAFLPLYSRVINEANTLLKKIKHVLLPG